MRKLFLVFAIPESHLAAAHRISPHRMAMFGCIVAGRLYVFELPDPASINHLVVFLTGSAPFPPGYAATVHFLWQVAAPYSWPSLVTPSWTLLGHISNEKPSAIFRLGGKKSITGKSMDALMDDTDQSPFAAVPTVSAQLGISIEPIQTVMAQISTLPSGAHSLTAQGMGSVADMSMVVAQSGSSLPLLSNVSLDAVQSIATKLVDNLFNYCTSFAGGLPPNGTALFRMDLSSTFVPLKAKWYNNTQRKIKTDPNFLK
eukprot:jgi/Hompol1/5706/HPOL_001107-RA